jgi:hypothetical protein
MTPVPRDALDQCPEIMLFGSVTATLHGYLIDDEYFLQAAMNDNSLWVYGTQGKLANYSLAAFFADCIAFEQDMATLALPAHGELTYESIPWIFKPRHREDLPEIYQHHLLSAWDNSVDAYDGIWFMPQPYYDPSITNLPFSMWYADLRIAVHLYNAAMRQLDSLSQFLHFYRIFENLQSGNGKTVLRKVLDGSLEYKSSAYVHPLPGIPPQEHAVLQAVAPDVEQHIREAKLAGPDHRINVTEVRRAEALARLAVLRSQGMSTTAIVDYLYSETRCGIAHGQRIKRHDLGSEFVALARDAKLIRYLARLAIESRLT